ncbi:MAG: response regulator [Marinomonas sp.]
MVDINTVIRSGSVRPLPSYAHYSALVADEFENSRQSIRQMLLSIGVGAVDQASTGKGIIEACHARKYDLVLCDFRLGHGKNGQQVLEELRQLKILKSTALFIVVSAETSRDVVFGIMESHPDEYLSKPFTQGVLSKRLERLFIQNDVLLEMKKAQAMKDYSLLVSLCKDHIRAKGRYSVWCKKALVDTFLATASWKSLTQLCEAELVARDIDWAMLGIAKMYVLRKEWGAAIKHLEATIKSFPQCAPCYDLLASCLEQKGQSIKAQEVLAEGVRLSPLILSRQQMMVDISLENNDMHAALKASQQTLKLAVNTINESPEQYFQLADMLSEAAVDGDGREHTKMTEEALSTLNKVTRKYSELHDVRLKKALCESRLHSYQGNDKQSAVCLASAMGILEEFPEIKTIDITIQLGKTLYLAGKKEEAEKQWQLVEQDSEITSRQEQSIFDFIDEPIPIGARAKAKALNAEGLRNYAKKEFDEAIRIFEEALAFSPNHPGLNLNLVQTIIKKMETIGKSKMMLNKCHQAFDRLKHVGKHHKQFSRLQTLKEFMDKYK